MNEQIAKELIEFSKPFIPERIRVPLCAFIVLTGLDAFLYYFMRMRNYDLDLLFWAVPVLVGLVAFILLCCFVSYEIKKYRFTHSARYKAVIALHEEMKK